MGGEIFLFVQGDARPGGDVLHVAAKSIADAPDALLAQPFGVLRGAAEIPEFGEGFQEEVGVHPVGEEGDGDFFAVPDLDVSLELGFVVPHVVFLVVQEDLRPLLPDDRDTPADVAEELLQQGVGDDERPLRGFAIVRHGAADNFFEEVGVAVSVVVRQLVEDAGDGVLFLNSQFQVAAQAGIDRAVVVAVAVDGELLGPKIVVGVGVGDVDAVAKEEDA